MLGANGHLTTTLKSNSGGKDLAVEVAIADDAGHRMLGFTWDGSHRVLVLYVDDIGVVRDAHCLPARIPGRLQHWHRQRP